MQPALFGAPNPTFTGTIVGIKNGDNITATYSTLATTNSPTGNISDYSCAGGSKPAS